MGRTDLPREVHQEPLCYAELISTLCLIDGESVVVKLSACTGEPAFAPGVASIIGELRHQAAARYGGHEFSIGSPYPDRYPDQLAGGILFINEQTFQSATLTTFDGNDYFAVSIKTRCSEILIQDGDSGYP